ncbi:hypothetical protein J5N97_028066 [Dioscorea zingiberensis]|uniref:Uncharacterized protein n=1 Tax=Dioscorea zingiberensis TaxID=325984 RepID=A0A9D5H4J4_9LILI|nr:hypothetical protein J5N97_028066 [Dioscorea zingiberensis]
MRKSDGLTASLNPERRKLHEGEASRTVGKKRKAPDNAMGMDRKTTAETANSHTVSAAVDDFIVEEVRKLRNIIEVTITKGFAGIRPHDKVKQEMAAMMAPDLIWKVQPFEDDRVDRMLLHCPSEELAKKIESMKEIEFPGFSVRCDPCTAATNATGKADGELQWITAKGLPIFCQRRDTLERLLKPVGDLAYMAKGGAFYAGQCRAVVRIRRGKMLTTTINYNVLNEKFIVKIQLDRGETPLPWDPSPEKTAAQATSQMKDGDTSTPANEKTVGSSVKTQRSKKDATADETEKKNKEKVEMLPSYPPSDENEMDETNTEFEDQVIREIELEMENMWNAPLE